jgi:hypothetical protein
MRNTASSGSRLRIGLAAAALLGLSAVPAAADFCIRLDGGDFSGDIGFFRFAGKVPTEPKAMLSMAGRAAGTGEPVFGSAVTDNKGKNFQLGATFFIDGEQGQFTLSMNVKSGTGEGRGRYGEYGTGSFFDAEIVSCSEEPN